MQTFLLQVSAGIAAASPFVVAQAVEAGNPIVGALATFAGVIAGAHLYYRAI